MKEKRLVPKRRLKEFQGEEGWVLRSFGEFSSVKMNKRIFKYQTTKTGEVPFYKIGTFGGTPDSFISRKLFNEYKENYPFPNVGDILISASGSIGRTVEYTGENEYFQDSNIVWIEHKGILDNRFLKQFFNIVKWEGLEGSTIKRLYNKNILETDIFVPTFNEQKKIGVFFQKLDDLIELYEEKLSKLEETRESYLHKMFPQKGSDVPEMRFEGFYGPWEVKNLGQLLRYKQPTEYLVSSDLYDDRNSVPVLTAGQSFILGYTSETFGLKKASVENPVIIFDDFTTSSHYVDFEFKVKSSALKILSAKNLQDNLYFLYYALNEIKYKPMNHQRHWISVFSEFEILTPSVEEQQLIGNFFKNLDDQINAQERKLDKLREMKKAYLEEMFV